MTAYLYLLHNTVSPEFLSDMVTHCHLCPNSSVAHLWVNPQGKHEAYTEGAKKKLTKEHTVLKL